LGELENSIRNAITRLEVPELVLTDDLLVSAVITDPRQEMMVMVIDPGNTRLKLPGGKNDKARGEKGIDAIARKISIEVGLNIRTDWFEEVWSIPRWNKESTTNYTQVIYKVAVGLEGVLPITISGHKTVVLGIDKVFQRQDIIPMHLGVLKAIRAMGLI
jgi:hypothetical protein